MTRTIYLDYNATSPIDERVFDFMLPYLRDHFGNPSSAHVYGSRARAAVEQAREHVAALVGGRPSGVTFTAGATEANNLIVKAVAEANRSDRHRILVSAGEHKSVLESARWLDDRGIAKVEYIPLTASGDVDIDALAATSGFDVLLISCTAANSETGVLNPLDRVEMIASDTGAMVHADATQLVGRLPFDMTALGIDFVSLSGHKISGPKGSGAVVASKRGRQALVPLTHGGGQEGDLRSGTLNVPGVAGFGEASRIALSERDGNATNLARYRNALEAGLISVIPELAVNGALADRLPNTSNIRFIGADAEAVMAQMPEIAVSTGSACSSGSIEPSHVLIAMGLDRVAAHEVLRFSVGESTSSEDIEAVIARTAESVAFVREMMGS
jgi:cysteine desulfurase